MTHTEELFAQLLSYLSLDRICKDGETMYAWDRMNDFKSYRKTADFIEKSYREAGADEVERIPIPCDGEYRFGDWIMPCAWDIEGGQLELLDNCGNRAMLLADYQAEPISVIRWSKSTGGADEIMEMVYVPDAADEKVWQTGKFAGKLIFTHSNAVKVYRLADIHGAAGIVTDFSTDPEFMEDKVHWCNVWTGYSLWGTTKDDRQLFGFCLTPAGGKKLTRHFKKTRNGVLKVRVNVKAEFYHGSTDVITAVIKGSEEPEKEVIFYGHLHECKIDDNPLAPAIFIELIRTIREMSANGVIAPLKKSIRFITGWEWIGSDYYALFHRKNRQWLASATYDAIAGRIDWGEQALTLTMSPAYCTSFADALFVDLWKKFCHRIIPKIPWRTAPWAGGSDNYLIDPELGGLSNIWAYLPETHAWHKSHSNLSWVEMSLLHYQALIAALWSLKIAMADVDDARGFAKLACNRCEREIRRHAADFDFTKNDFVKFKHQQSVLALKAENMIDSSSLYDDCGLKKFIAGCKTRINEVLDEELFCAEKFNLPAEPDFTVLTQRRIAKNIVPERIIKAPLRSLCKLPGPDIRIADRAPLALFMIDNKKSLEEIVQTCSFETQKDYDYRQTIRNFRMLEKGGYVKLHYCRTFGCADLVADLRRLGIKTGDTLLVHSSLFAIGPLENGADTVFAALEEAVGTDGTVCLPAFAYNTVSGCPNSPFDPVGTPSRVGTLTNLFLKRPGVLRSLHPSHGLAAIGKYAEEIIADNRDYSPYDIRGAFGKLYRLDAKILMLGSGLAANSTLHVLEDWADLPSMMPDKYHYLDEHGQRREIEYAKEPFFCRSFYEANAKISVYERVFTAAGIITGGDVGLAPSYLMPVRRLVDTGLGMIAAGDVDFLFCRDCESCRKVRRELQDNWQFPSQFRNVTAQLINKSSKKTSKGVAK